MSKNKLLILDDEPRILTALQDLFEDDYDVFVTTDALEALRLAKELDVVVVVTDARMPDLSGHEFLRRVKEVSKASRMMLSGYADINAVTEAVNKGQIFAYVSKPWDPLELKTTVSAATAHFRLNEAIHQERELLRVLMESIPDLIYFKDANSRFTRVNREYARALGAGNPQDCIGKLDADYLEDEYAIQSYLDEQEIMRSGKPLIDRTEHMRMADGSECWLSTTKVPVFDSIGGTSGIAGISRDITNLKNIEENLQRTKHAAESASRAKSEFLAVMSHEIRTPMNAILGVTDLLSRTALNPEQRDYVAISQRGGATLLNLINNILDLSKVESGRFELDLNDFDLGAMLEKTTEMMLPRARSSGLRFTCEILPGVPLQLTGDSGRLRQILLNLIGNALKFTAKGSVLVRVEWDAEDGEAGALRFSVIDTGIGIAPDKTEIIFSSFTQADSSTTRNYGGTGLGLSICKGMVDLMGGRIGCDSAAGVGSTFYFTAPFGLRLKRRPPLSVRIDSPREVTTARAVAPPTEKRTARRILIVEDCEDNLFLVEAYLKGHGFDLDVAENGKIAVEKVIGGVFDLVLMDMQMPVMDGCSATSAIRRWEQENHRVSLPILALTANTLKQDVEKCMASGCTAFLSKPICQSDLLDAISRHTSGNDERPPLTGVVNLTPR